MISNLRQNFCFETNSTTLWLFQITKFIPRISSGAIQIQSLWDLAAIINEVMNLDDKILDIQMLDIRCD